MQLQFTLKQCMRERSLSYTKLARLSGVKLNTLRDWGSNGTAPRDLDAVRAVARALGVSFEYLIFGSETSIPDSVDEMLESVPTQVLHSGWAKITIEVPRKRTSQKNQKE